MNFLKKQYFNLNRNFIKQISTRNQIFPIYFYINQNNFKPSKFNMKLTHFHFSDSTNEKVPKSDIISKLIKEGSVTIYMSRYPFKVEKFLSTTSIIMVLISGTTILTTTSYFLKLINLIVVFIPCLGIFIEYMIGQIRYIKNIKLLPENKIELKTIFDKKEVLSITDLKKIEDDQRFSNKEKKFNNFDYILFTNKNNTAIYHIHRDAIFLNEDIFYDIIEGKFNL